ncbi:hypothetical protein BISA_2175 [Bifidobacterium saguini DSM 23967]|uniref:Uncharacterized protein n=3 Tax=Bifidobacterium TaxID=1678 RepID=A0A2N5IQ60_9BIFI|nr:MULTISPECIES: hypothetical protein [Bifidobacterium]KFI94435.1 hypothetical protein BISA_2175 [Bifidobacterium saguini DSM 23967]PLS24087.1 hypothetical protein Tam1G_1848 [Bifidobacterium imperatoris]QSY58309.1 hypothetical protein BLI708_03140 [Bifidobacterium imperatoris]QTB90002.1 hypothetical protein BSD967_06400 [Bifidobacterium saguini]
MGKSSEEYDFFDGAEYEDAPQSQRRQRAKGPHSSGRRAAKIKLDSPASKILRRLALFTGLLAVAASASSAVHEIAPYAISFLVKVPGRYIAATAAVLIGLTLMFVIGARTTMPRNSTHGGVGGGGIVTIVLAGACLVVGVAVGVLFPQGLILPNNDKAPVESTAQMEQGIEQSAGQCTSGWQGLDAGGLPGVSTVQMCTEPRMAFVSFESEAMAAVGKAPIKVKIAELLNQYSDNEKAQGDWRLLSGKRWMVFGEADKMTALQQQWGGDLEPITAADDSADATSSDSGQ